MKIGRYKIVEPSPHCEVSDVQVKKDENNNVTLNWKWPNDQNQKFMLLFDNHAELELEELLRLTVKQDIHSIVISRQLEKDYKEKLTVLSKRYKLFPMTFSSSNNDEILVINQKQGNMSDEVKLQIKVLYTYQEKSLFLNNHKKVTLKIEPDLSEQKTFNLEFGRLEDIVYYVIKKGDYHADIKYPIDQQLLLFPDKLEINIHKDENIEIIVKEPYKDFIILRQKI